WFLARFPKTVGVAYNADIHDGWALQWELRPRLSAGNQPVVATVGEGTRVYIMDTRGVSSGDLRAAARRYHVHAVGHLGVFPRAGRQAPLGGYGREEGAPSIFQRGWRGPYEPIRSVRRSAWTTWEWRTMLGQPATVPASAPVTTDELRIAHNAAVE